MVDYFFTQLAFYQGKRGVYSLHSSMLLLSQHPLYTLFKGPEGGMVEMDQQDEMAEMDHQDVMEPKEDKDQVEELVYRDLLVHEVC